MLKSRQEAIFKCCAIVIYCQLFVMPATEQAARLRE